VSSDISLQPTPRRKLTEAVAQQLLDHIRTQRLTPGTRMPSERELMRALNVGRSTVREALNGLALMGVIEVRHGQGAFVAAVPQENGSEELASSLAKGVTRDLLEARHLIEIEVVRLAAERRTAADLRSMRRALREHAADLAKRAVAAHDSANFHLEIAAAAHNEVLAAIVASFMPLLEELGPALEQLPGYRAWELEQHEELFEAIRAGDAQLAAERMTAHLDAMVEHHERLNASS
jgi:GntR family transcriptional regulator, transcriptional repressor for pyruvate dehydrogenase complex